MPHKTLVVPFFLAVSIAIVASVIANTQKITSTTMELLYLLGLLGAGTAFASESLFVASYAGAVSTLKLGYHEGNTYSLKNTSVNLGCFPNPTWLTLDKPSNTLYCLGEGLATPNGSLSSYHIGENGTLTQLSYATSPNGPVYGALYGSRNGTTAMALANYGAHQLSSFTVQSPNMQLSPLQNLTLAPPNPPGPVTARQNLSYPHSTILEPTGQYIVVPDLGADLVRVYSYDQKSGMLQAAGQPLHVASGSGPRHAAFFVNGNTTYMYVVAELGATITGYCVEYLPNNGGLSFTQMYVSDTLGGAKPSRIVAPAEVRIAPDSKYLIVSNRNDSTFLLPNTNPKNATAIPSDSMASYAIMPNGTLQFAQLFPAYGSFPRNFDINKAGDKVAIGLQNDGRVAVFQRNPVNGLVGAPLAIWEGAGFDAVGQITRVVWNE